MTPKGIFMDIIDRPSHHNLPVVNSVIDIFKVILAFIIDDENQNSMNSSEIGAILNISASPIPNITRFLSEIGIIITERLGNNINYTLSDEGEVIAYEIKVNNRKKVAEKLSILLPNYFVIENSINYIKSKGSIKRENLRYYINDDLDLNGYPPYINAIEIIIDLMIFTSLVTLDSNAKLKYAVISKRNFKSNLISFDKLFDEIIGSTSNEGYEFIIDKINPFMKRKHHHHLTRKSSIFHILDVIKVMKNCNRPLQTIDIALKLNRRSPSATRKDIRFLGAMGLIISGKIGRKPYYILTKAGNALATHFVQN